MATQAFLKLSPGGVAETLDAMLAADGSVNHAYPASAELLYGRNATRNLADVAHYLCMLHGRHPGVIELAAMRETDAAARAWLATAAQGFALERSFLTRIAVAAGPLPSTPGHAECESAVMGQRHALETLAQSERAGCALGAAIALVMDWKTVRHVLDVAAERLGVAPQPARLPDERETRAVADRLAGSNSVARAIAFGAQQILAQHRGLWTMLDSRRHARAAD
jgi:hypothetical protein